MQEDKATILCLKHYCFVWSFLLHVKEILNPESTVGAPSWVYYSVYAFFVFLFNIFDIANLPKEIADYLNKMGARIPNIKPGKATIEYLTKIQASTRFWDKAKLPFTSVLIIVSVLSPFSIIHLNHSDFMFVDISVDWFLQVGSIIELRRSYHAYNVMQSLSKALKMHGMSKISNLDYAALNLVGDNYLQWALDTEIVLKSKGLGECIIEDNNASESNRYMAIMITRQP
ncbi:hypothetical protein YC2023_049364 [Brassica napus]